MGIPSELRDLYANRKNPLLIQSPYEDKILRSRQQWPCSKEGMIAGAKAAAAAGVVSAVPTLIAVRKIPWAKANLNRTHQRYIVSIVTMIAFDMKWEKTAFECRRRNALYKP